MEEKHHKDKGHFFIKLPDDKTAENEKQLLDFVFEQWFGGRK